MKLLTNVGIPFFDFRSGF